ncbi:hypothetical protein TanjilG_08840 [Lupinus angustifolius]|uniref:DUF4378 domain-containing protein n=1 Tax=Lupinus angustifolius TaxID=3871 RepID=A0A1J7IXK9_LUPAN|nr:PREDICTED: uncharacterized protein LOC109329657 [Lupinus angustifolius]OIW17562.1 hypothetical protein TanjilG_08840 [Lupinus angustifolius]
MNDSSVQNLAITEKKAEKPGGCVGIVFQLFEWKRKLAKKKLFSKKLLLPAPAKKLNGDKRMPNSKLHLIANENNGGFPSPKKGTSQRSDVDQKTEMQVPSLVARLMGLEAIPAAQRDKPKKALVSDNCGDEEKEFLGRVGVDLEVGVVKHDSRPQKLQKTGTSDRMAVTRFGAEALQIKSVLSRARKNNQHHHHHPKLASPLKSPRITSGKGTSRSSRLIGAATKILEPGLHNKSRFKGSLTYSSPMYPPKTGTVTNFIGTGSAVMQNQSCYDAASAKPSMEHTSCQNCGTFLDVVECTPEVRRPPAIVPDVIAPTSIVSAWKNARTFSPSHEHERDIVLLRSKEKIISVFTEQEGKNNAQVQQSCNGPATRRMPMPRESPATWNSSHKPFRTLDDDASSSALKQKTQTQEQMSSSERLSSGSAMSNMQVKRVSSSMSTVSGTKDFVAFNRNISSRTRMRSPMKVDSSKFDTEKKPRNRQHNSVSYAKILERKRRTLNVTQVEGTASVNSNGVRLTKHHSDALGGKRRDFSTSSKTSSNIKSKQGGQGKTVKVNDNKINEVVSFTFNSPLKQELGIRSATQESSSNNERKTCFRRPSTLRIDALGAFLEQRLKELTSQEDDDLATGAPPEKPSATIIQELISALGSEQLICHDDHHLFNENNGVHYEAKRDTLSGTSCNGNHLSPGSVLEASFSSSSLDESSGHGFQPDSTNYSYDQLEHLEFDQDILDSATSFNKGRICSEKLTDRANQIPKALQSLYSFGTSLTTSNLTHMKDVILNAELVLGLSTKHSEDDVVPQSVISWFLLNELDTMADDAMWTDFNVFVCCEDSKQRKELKGFLFDCVIEYLESNCCRYFNCGFEAWTKLPLCMKPEILHQEVTREMKNWACLVGMVPNEIIEWEMSHSRGKWTDFDMEAFEAGVDMNGDIIEILVEEIVEDLLGRNLSTICF